MNKITIIGSGVMGHGIAQLYAQNGMNVYLYDIEQKALDKAKDMVVNSLSVMVTKEIISEDEKEKALNRISYSTDFIKSVMEADMVVEVVPEILKLKHETYDKIESVVSPDTIICSNTSAITLSELTKNAKYKDRFLITHFFAPAQLVPLVEIIKADDTREDLLNKTVEFLTKCGKSPIVLQKEVPGFIANRIQMAILRECFWLYENKIASAEDIDTVVKDSLGFRYVFLGPLEGQDIAGLNTPYFVAQNLFPHLSDIKGAPAFLKDMIDDNKLGLRTNEGFYKYKGNQAEEKLKTRDDNLLDVYKLVKSKK